MLKRRKAKNHKRISWKWGDNPLADLQGPCPSAENALIEWKDWGWAESRSKWEESLWYKID